MSLALKVYQKGEGGPTLMRERSFDTPRITLGRGADCEVTLEDPKKWVSRIHAVLNVEGDEYWLNVVSKVNPVFVAGQRHEPGSRVQVYGGDRVEIGEYEIELVPPAPPPLADPSEPTFITQPVPVAAEATFIGQPALEAPEAPGIVLDAIPEPAPALEPEPEPEPQRAAVTQPMPEPPPAPRAPVADDSVFAEATYTGAAPPAGVFDEPTFIGKSAAPRAEETEQSVEDSVFQEVTQLRNLPPPEDGFFDDPAPAAATPAPAEPEVPYEDRSVFLEQTLLRARSVETTFPQPGEEGSAGQAAGPGAQGALQVFFEGVGLPPRSFSGDAEAEQYLRQCGAITRAAIDGVMALLVARAEAKKEFRAEDRTMVASRDNNPLKLMADPQEAVDFLFDPKERSGGFLTPVQAVSDAFDDMRAHEAALIAGMRAAILGAVARFDPKALEEQLEKSSGGLGLNRKARLWELFAAYQQKLARDASDDFNKVFGRDFLSAYMAQVKQLKKK